MEDQILPNIYRIEIPLPNNPLKYLNSYLVKGDERFLMIDTGMNRKACRREMASALQRLNVDLDRTDFFITHLHADHLGLVGDLASETSRVYFNQTEASIVQAEGAEERWQEYFLFYLSHGFPETELKESMDNHPGRRYRSTKQIEFSIAEDGDTIETGNYTFRCIDTRGHSPGHMCLYEPEKKLLLSGDHILFDITPNITYWPELPNSLNDYLKSLIRVYDLDVELVLPGHRNSWHNLKSRISELQEHHEARLNEVITALDEGEKTAFQVAPYITWDIECKSWEEFPTIQKWFAIGETVAHLNYLEEQGRINRRTEGNSIVFAIK